MSGVKRRIRRMRERSVAGQRIGRNLVVIGALVLAVLLLLGTGTTAAWSQHRDARQQVDQRWEPAGRTVAEVGVIVTSMAADANAYLRTGQASLRTRYELLRAGLEPLFGRLAADLARTDTAIHVERAAAAVEEWDDRLSAEVERRPGSEETAADRETPAAVSAALDTVLRRLATLGTETDLATEAARDDLATWQDRLAILVTAGAVLAVLVPAAAGAGTWALLRRRGPVPPEPPAVAELAVPTDVEIRQRRERAALVAREQERYRIADAIHDDQIQSMTSALLNLQRLRRRDRFDPDAVSEVENEVVRAIGRLRHLIFDLRPSALEDEGLTAALELWLLESADDQGLTWRVGGNDEGLSEATRAVAYRAAKECLQNVLKHAQATSVDVVVEHEAGGVAVWISDDGIGFQADGDPSIRPGHLGLAGAHDAIRSVGGRLMVATARGAGTTVAFFVPEGDDPLDPVDEYSGPLG